MKKIAVSVALIMVSILAACSAKDKESIKDAANKATVTAAPTATPTPTPTPAGNASTKPIDKNGKMVALTFDDGPTYTTPMILDQLDKYGVIASHFIWGSRITEANKSLLVREVTRGDELGNHSWYHNTMSSMSEDKVKAEIQRCSDKVKEITGVTPKFFRAPNLATGANMFKAIDMPFINGITCNDWTASVTAEQRAEMVLKAVKDGTIILMHEADKSNQNTVAALDIIIPELQKQGYQFVTVSQLFEYKGVDPNVENKCWTYVTK